MQTFLPYPCFVRSLSCLDYKRLGKQRVEAMQIVLALAGQNRGWFNHPATIMWRNHIPALKLYHNTAIMCWVSRGYKNTMNFFTLDKNEVVQMPPWLGDPDFHAAHRSNLLRKNPAYYSQFGWTESPNLEYIWPSSLEKNQ